MQIKDLYFALPNYFLNLFSFALLPSNSLAFLLYARAASISVSSTQS